MDPADAVVLTSDEAIEMYRMAGKLTVTDAEFYFSCPLLPVK
jgi:hypothetical protein